MTVRLILLALIFMLGACASGARSSFDLQDRAGARPMGLISAPNHPIRVYLDAEDRAAIFQQAFRALNSR